MTYRLDLSATAEDSIRNLVNHRFNTSFTETQLIWRPEGAGVLSKQRREFLKLPKDRDSYAHANFADGWYGSKVFYFTRVDTNKFFAGVFASAPRGQYIETKELLPYIADDLGLVLRDTDIVSTLIPVDADEVEVQIHPSNLCYKGTVLVRFGEPVGNRRLVDRVLITDLGLYPVA